MKIKQTLLEFLFSKKHRTTRLLIVLLLFSSRFIFPPLFILGKYEPLTDRITIYLEPTDSKYLEVLLHEKYHQYFYNKYPFFVDLLIVGAFLVLIGWGGFVVLDLKIGKLLFIFSILYKQFLTLITEIPAELFTRNYSLATLEAISFIIVVWILYYLIWKEGKKFESSR